jgi:hypothetical protein
VLSPSGKLSKIGKLLSLGGYTVAFGAPSAGKLVIDW